MARLSNKLDAVYLYKPAGHGDSMLVESRQTVEVPGDAKDVGDAYVVGKGDAALAFPKSRWDLVREPKAEPVKEPAKKSANENDKAEE